MEERDPPRGVAYWMTRSPAERLAEVDRLRVERIRAQFGLGPDDPLPRMERVMRILTWEEWAMRDRTGPGGGPDG